MLRDFSAQVGDEGFMENIAGTYTLHQTTNENGQFLGQFAAAQNLKIKSTSFQNKNNSLGYLEIWHIRTNQELDELPNHEPRSGEHLCKMLYKRIYNLIYNIWDHEKIPRLEFGIDLTWF